MELNAMSLEHSPARSEGVIVSDGADASDGQDDPDYWHRLINERAAGDFLGLTDRTMQAMRQRGGGPRYVLISSRCLRYTRFGLRSWAESRMKSSTSDPGSEPVAA